MSKKSFCLDVSSLDDEQRSEFAEILKTTINEFNKTLDIEETQNQDGESEND